MSFTQLGPYYHYRSAPSYDTFDNSRKECEGLGGHLAYFKTAEELGYLNTMQGLPPQTI